MTSGRLSAFTDGIVAILITVMVLNLRIPKGPNWTDLFDMGFIFLTYLASFTCWPSIGITIITFSIWLNVFQEEFCGGMSCSYFL